MLQPPAQVLHFRLGKAISRLDRAFTWAGSASQGTAAAAADVRSLPSRLLPCPAGKASARWRRGPKSCGVVSWDGTTCSYMMCVKQNSRSSREVFRASA